ncbi:MAG: glycosyltransferase [Clostridiales Family XIII bacterium]|jgi:glycosyltransferase EpsD|nr:glycosyltransferase [Clostridiales Family XIII bacterium]
MSKKVLFAASVKPHLLFHAPHMEWFRERGYEVHACARGGPGGPELAHCDRFMDIGIRRSPFRLANIAAYRQLKSIIDENAYDLISCHTPVCGVLTRLAARRARRRGSAVMYTAHGFHFYAGAPIMNWLMYYPAERLCAGVTDMLVTINAEDFAFAKARLPARRVRHMHGVGVDAGAIRAAEADVRRLRDENGVPQDAALLISVGETNRNKNHITVLRALKTLLDRGVDGFRYLICGDGEGFGRLRGQTEALGLAGHVRLLGRRDDVIALLKASDVFLFPSFREGLPKSLMEAMAAGLPAVCSDIRGNRDLIRDGEGGLMARPDDVEGFAAAIQRMMDSPSTRLGMGRENMRAVEPYDLGNVMREYEAIVAEAMELRDGQK